MTGGQGQSTSASSLPGTYPTPFDTWSTPGALRRASTFGDIALEQLRKAFDNLGVCGLEVIGFTAVFSEVVKLNRWE
jgi:hypothetical protein